MVSFVIVVERQVDLYSNKVPRDAFLFESNPFVHDITVYSLYLKVFHQCSQSMFVWCNFRIVMELSDRSARRIRNPYEQAIDISILCWNLNCKGYLRLHWCCTDTAFGHSTLIIDKFIRICFSMDTGSTNHERRTFQWDVKEVHMESMDLQRYH